MAQIEFTMIKVTDPALQGTVLQCYALSPHSAIVPSPFWLSVVQLLRLPPTVPTPCPVIHWRSVQGVSIICIDNRWIWNWGCVINYPTSEKPKGETHSLTLTVLLVLLWQVRNPTDVLNATRRFGSRRPWQSTWWFTRTLVLLTVHSAAPPSKERTSSSTTSTMCTARDSPGSPPAASARTN